jgi:hypothetical protein
MCADYFFTTVFMDMVQVGHTHEDIDQMFSRFSVALRHLHARSRPELAKVLLKAYCRLDRVIHLEHVANISEYFNEYKVRLLPLVTISV